MVLYLRVIHYEIAWHEECPWKWYLDQSCQCIIAKGYASTGVLFWLAGSSVSEELRGKHEM